MGLLLQVRALRLRLDIARDRAASAMRGLQDGVMEPEAEVSARSKDRD